MDAHRSWLTRSPRRPAAAAFFPELDPAALASLRAAFLGEPEQGRADELVEALRARFDALGQRPRGFWGDTGQPVSESFKAETMARWSGHATSTTGGGRWRGGR